MHPVSGTNTHHDVTDLVSHDFVAEITFKKILIASNSTRTSPSLALLLNSEAATGGVL